MARGPHQCKQAGNTWRRTSNVAASEQRRSERYGWIIRLFLSFQVRQRLK
jgi:hypothetical protein